MWVGNSHARCRAGENLEIISKDYLLLYIVIVSNDKKKLVKALPSIIQKLKETNQRLNKKKTKIDTAYHGVPFLGKVSYPYGYQKPKKTTIIRIYQKAITIKYTDINNLLAKTNSQIGMLKSYNCRKLILNYAKIVENRVNKIIYLDKEKLKFNCITN